MNDNKKNRRQKNISFGGDIDPQVFFEKQKDPEKKRVKSMHKREVSMGDVMPDPSDGKDGAMMEQIDEDQPENEITAHEIKEDDILDFDLNQDSTLQIQSMFASTTKDDQEDHHQIASVQEDNPQMGGIEPDLDSQKPAPLKPSAWPLLSPFVKFLNDITKTDIQSQLSPDGEQE